MDWKVIKSLSQHAETGTIVDLVENDKGEQFVLKRVQHLETPLYKAIFQKETQALSRLKACDNIVRIYRTDIVNHGNNCTEGIISMEYIPGKPINEIMECIPNISTRYLIVRQLSNAIRYAHQNAVIHRDINPSNIIVTDDFNLKLIDFGIAKIRGMFQSGTTYQFATQSYSAPEVALHSENATEQSDIYSLGAVIYFLFTGIVPPSADNITNAILSTGGIDAKLKATLCKMCAMNPKERFENIDDCEIALSDLYIRYCGSEEKYYFAVPTNQLNYLKDRSIVSRKMTNEEMLRRFLPERFSGACIRKKTVNDAGGSVYYIDGISISMECVLKDNVFHVISFFKLDTYKKEQYKRYSVELPGHFIFEASYRINTVHLSNNCDEIVVNRIEDYQDDLTSKKNIDFEYYNQYGIWRDFIKAMIQDASKNAVRLFYKKVEYNNGLIILTLEQDNKIDEDFNQETTFVIEKTTPKKKSLVRDIGTFIEFRNDGETLILKPSSKSINLPQKGSVCVDYRREIQQYKRQEIALEEFIRSETANTGNLKSIIVGVEMPRVFQMKHGLAYFNKSLDITQKRAVKKVIEADDIALIQGPPGTGKTNVLVEVVRQILNENSINPALNQKILIVSQSHAAVDKILEDLEPYISGVTTIRIGNEENVSQDIYSSFGLDPCQNSWTRESVEKCTAQLNQRLVKYNLLVEEFLEYSKQIESMSVSNIETKEKANLEKTINDFERIHHFSRTDTYIKECLIMSQWILHLAEAGELGEYYINNASIVAGTCNGFISHPFVRNAVFDYVIVDEAAKATLPEIMVSLVRSRKVVLVGDHKQLPPVFDTDALSRSEEKINIKTLQNSGFGKMFEIVPDECKETLSTQYRMHPAIGDLVSQLFYDGKVQNGLSEEDRALAFSFLDNRAITWISTSQEGSVRFEQDAGKGKSGFVNSIEVTTIKRCLNLLDKAMEETQSTYTVGVITPYRAQLELIKKRLSNETYRHFKVDINTVDAFQGSQRDIIIYSTVRSSKKPTIGFLREKARLNVSFSRAKSALIIIGDSDFLNDYRIKGNDCFPVIIQYIQSHGETCKMMNAKEISNVK